MDIQRGLHIIDNNRTRLVFMHGYKKQGQVHQKYDGPMGTPSAVLIGLDIVSDKRQLVSGKSSVHISPTSIINNVGFDSAGASKRCCIQ